MRDTQYFSIMAMLCITAGLSCEMVGPAIIFLVIASAHLALAFASHFLGRRDG